MCIATGYTIQIADSWHCMNLRRTAMLHDVTKMSEERRNKEYLARLETNLAFVMADVMEQLWTECENINQECGYTMRNEEKRHYNAMKHNLQRLRGVTRTLGEKDQMEFGDDAEITLDLLYAAVTRTGTDTMMMCRFLEYIMSFPDRIGLEKVRRGSDAFEAIKKKLGIA